MNVQLHAEGLLCNAEIGISGSKSETNRMLVLQSLYPEIAVENASNSDDSNHVRTALKVVNNENSKSNQIIDIQHAGTAMRFLTAFFSTQEGIIITLTGSSRMKERPIKILVDALRELGAEIKYLENDGFPPIQIFGKKITKNKVTLPASMSSQYISAVLLIAPKLENGLELTLTGTITSLPYITMTLNLLNQIGIETAVSDNKIRISPKKQLNNPHAISIESDWSSASYFYSIVALSEIGAQVILSNFKKNSIQGDSDLAIIYESFGVATRFHQNKIILRKESKAITSKLDFDLNHMPDCAQTIAVTCFGLGVACHLTGLHTLKIKETDRLKALKNELSKLGASIKITDNSLTLAPTSKIISTTKIATYNDHRMAMAFAPLALKTKIEIENAEVVSKSYPNFWTDLEQIGFEITKKINPLKAL